MLTITDLAVERDGRIIFEQINLSLNSGELALLHGPNGSGKTTLLRCLSGIVSPSAGNVYFQSTLNVQGDEKDLLYISHRSTLKSELTVSENIRQHALWEKVAMTDESIEAMLIELDLLIYFDTEVQKLSEGQRRRLSLCRIWFSKSLLWLLDEPFVSLDAQYQQLLANLISNHCQNGGAVILTSHQALPNALIPTKTIKMSGKGPW